MRINSNSTIWITGASSGIGEQLAYQLAVYQPLLVLSARNIEKLEKVAAKCQDIGAGTMVVPLDLANADSIQAAVNSVLTRTDKLDLLVNNAGVSQRSLAYETDLEVDRKIMEINYFGTITLTKLLLPRFMSQKNGHIVVVSSLAGKLGFPLRSAYSASKHALHGFFETLALELSSYNVNITIAIPSHIKTDIDLKALTADGKPFNREDPGIKNGIPADKCARKIIKAIERDKYQVFIAGKDKIAYYVHKVSPKAYFWLIKKLNLK